MLGFIGRLDEQKGIDLVLNSEAGGTSSSIYFTSPTFFHKTPLQTTSSVSPPPKKKKKKKNHEITYVLHAPVELPRALRPQSSIRIKPSALSPTVERARMRRLTNELMDERTDGRTNDFAREEFLMNQHVQVVFLGSGREDLQNRLMDMQGRNHDRVRSWIG